MNGPKQDTVSGAPDTEIAGAALVDHLRIEYGDRVADYLRTAQDLLDSRLESPSLGEAVVSCLRGAIETVLKSSYFPTKSKGEWGKLSREVVGAFELLDSASDLTGAEARRSFDELAARIGELDRFHQQERGSVIRQLEDVLSRRTGFNLTPSAGERFQILWDRLNFGIHRGATVEDAREMTSECFAVLRQLFTPPQVRHSEIERLARVVEPSPEDHLQLVDFLATPNNQRAFFERVESLAWFPLLYESGHLYPSGDDRMWPAAAAFERLASDNPDEIKQWFEKLYADRGEDPMVAWLLLQGCLSMGEVCLEVALQAVKDHPEDRMVLMLGVRAVEKCAAPESRWVETFADELLNMGNESTGRDFGSLVDSLAEGIDAANAARRIELLCNKLRTVDQSDLDVFDWHHGGSIADMARDPYGPRRISVLVAGLIDVLSKASEFLSASEVIGALTRLPSKLYRVRSWVLAESLDDRCDIPVVEVQRGIESRFPTGDDMRLIDRIGEKREPSSYTDIWRQALGTAPGVEEVGRALAAREVPEEWRRKQAWTALLPRETVLDWSAACDILNSRYGQITRHTFEQSESPVVTVGEDSPISIEDLRSVDPETAADMIRDWRPDGDGWPYTGARRLAMALEEVVTRDIGEWTSDPLRIVTKLHHPTYIGHYLTAIAKADGDHDLPINGILDVIQLIRTRPWEAVPLSGNEKTGYDRDWSGAERASIDLVRALADLDADLGDRSEEVWDLLAEAIKNRSDQPWSKQGGERDPRHSAINRTSTRALETVIHLLASEFRLSKTLSSERAIGLFEESLSQTGDEGADHRSILAPTVEFLLHVLPEWAEARLDLFFGSEAPGDLGQLSFDQYIKWGRPTTRSRLFETYRQMLRDAVHRGVPRALDFMLIAMLSKTRGYSVTENMNFLIQHPELVSKSGRILARLIREDDSPPEHTQIAEDYWRAALETSASLDGFGWFSETKTLEDETWAELTLQTLRKNADHVDWGNGVIERLMTMTPTETCLEIVRRLVQGPSNEWERSIIAEQAPDFLFRAKHLDSMGEYLRLHTALHERGLIQA